MTTAQTKAREEQDPTLSPPVEDNPGATDVRTTDGEQRPDDQTRREQDDEIAEPKGPPSDNARDAIYAKFEKRREAEARGEDPDAAAEGDPPDDGGNTNQDDPAARLGGPSDSRTGADDQQPKPLTLTVNGRTVTKSLEEVAALSELSVDEVRENPSRAIKYAQRELASTERLESAKRNSRSATPAPADADPGSARTAPNQERTQTGEDDEPGQHEPARKTTGKVDFEKLAEAIQIDDPKVAGQKLGEALNTIAEENAAKVRQDIDQNETGKRITTDRTSALKAVQEFVSEQKVPNDPYVASAMSIALTEEYKADLKTALEAEGDHEAVDFLMKRATPAQIRDAHQSRRINGDPTVRQINKDFVAKAYQRLPEGLRGKISPTNQQQKPGLQQRQEAKRSLPQQPTRASVPPATPPAPVKAPSRSEVVQEMRRARGQKPLHAR